LDSKKMDRRIKMTIIILQNTLIECLKENHISKISVKMLCEKSDINRSTFYSHFENQYKLLEYIYKECVANIKKYMQNQNLKDKKSISYKTLYRILDYIKQNSSLFKSLLSNNCDIDIQNEIFYEFLDYQNYNNIDDKTKDYLTSFGMSGCISVIQKWLKDDMIESTEKISEILIHALDKGVTNSDYKF